MSRDEIIAMAREAGLPLGLDCIAGSKPELRIAVELERFAALVEAKEREACALVCEDVSLQALTSWKLAYQPQDQGREMGADDCAAAIRARGAPDDLTQLTERGAKAWAGVDAQKLRDGDWP